MNKDQIIEDLEKRVSELVEGNNELRRQLEARDRLISNAAIEGQDAPEEVAEPKRRGRPPKAE